MPTTTRSLTAKHEDAVLSEAEVILAYRTAVRAKRSFGMKHGPQN